MRQPAHLDDALIYLNIRSDPQRSDLIVVIGEPHLTGGVPVAPALTGRFGSDHTQ